MPNIPLSLLAVALVIAVTSAQVIPLTQFPETPNFSLYAIEPLTLDDWCLTVGARSGCSGCNLGTNGHCSQVFEANDASVTFCVPAAKVPELTARGTYISGNLCPEDPLKEPLVGPLSLSIRNQLFAQTKSKQVKKGEYCQFPDGDYFVDRLSYTEFYWGSNSLFTQSACANTNSVTLHNLHRSYGVPGNCLVQSPWDERCLSLWASFMCFLECPPYGVAYTGFCEDDFLELKRVCGLSDIEGTCVPPASDLEDAGLIVQGEQLIELCSPMFDIPATNRWHRDHVFYAKGKTDVDEEECVPTDCQVVAKVTEGCDYSHCCVCEGRYLFDYSVIPASCGGESCEDVLEDLHGEDQDGVDCPYGNHCFVIMNTEECPEGSSIGGSTGSCPLSVENIEEAADDDLEDRYLIDHVTAGKKRDHDNFAGVTIVKITVTSEGYCATDACNDFIRTAGAISQNVECNGEFEEECDEFNFTDSDFDDDDNIRMRCVLSRAEENIVWFRPNFPGPSTYYFAPIVVWAPPIDESGFCVPGGYSMEDLCADLGVNELILDAEGDDITPMYPRTIACENGIPRGSIFNLDEIDGDSVEYDLWFDLFDDDDD